LSLQQLEKEIKPILLQYHHPRLQPKLVNQLDKLRIGQSSPSPGGGSEGSFEHVSAEGASFMWYVNRVVH